MPAMFTILVRDSAGAVHQHDLAAGSYVIGRRSDCDVSIPEPDVSRNHARITLEPGRFTIEDLGSSSGTFFHGDKLTSPKRLAYPQTIEIGSAQMFVSDQPPVVKPPAREDGKEADRKVRITVSLDAAVSGVPMHGVAVQQAERLEMLYTLPLQFAAEPDLEKLFKLILDRVMSLIPGSIRGALLVIEPSSNSLVLRASVPEDNPPISRSLIKRAAKEQTGFIWGDDENAGLEKALSIVKLGIRTGMYAPMLWKGRTMGVICVDNQEQRAVFSHEDLQFLISVANYAAAAIANQALQDDIEQNNRTLQNLLASFSPKLREKLMQKSREGRLQPGGEKSVVTILMSDLRGFAKASASLPAESIVEMLNDYFSILGDIIFQHDGTIDKFIGDAILAVFGSPEEDANHAHSAVKCALAMQAAIIIINERRRRKGLPFCELGVGIHTGEVLHGFIGAEERLEFTVIGDTVNKADRFCDGAKPGEIIIGPDTNEIVRLDHPTERRTIVTKHEGEWEAWVVKGGL